MKRFAWKHLLRHRDKNSYVCTYYPPPHTHTHTHKKKRAFSPFASLHHWSRQNAPKRFVGIAWSWSLGILQRETAENKAQCCQTVDTALLENKPKWPDNGSVDDARKSGHWLRRDGSVPVNSFPIFINHPGWDRPPINLTQMEQIW